MCKTCVVQSLKESVCPSCGGHGHSHAPVYDAIAEICSLCGGSGKVRSAPTEQTVGE